MTKNVVFLFAPQFRTFGCDVARMLLGGAGGGKVHAICVGSSELRDDVVAQLGELAGQVHWLPAMEAAWLSQPTDVRSLDQMETELGAGAFGRLVTADRRIGRGFVRGGLVRPDYIGSQALANPGDVPQRYMLGLYRFVSQLLDDTRPDVVFCYAVAAAPALTLAQLSSSRGIPFARISPSRLGSRFIVDDDPAGRHAPVARRFGKAMDDSSSLPAKALAEARKWIADFRDRPTIPEYMQRNHALLKADGPLRLTFRTLGFAAVDTLKADFTTRRYTPDFSRALFKSQVAWRRKYIIGDRPFSDAPAEDGFLFYPLHVDPEESTMVLEPFHTDQLAIIEALAKSAPPSMRIVVKEHAPMVGLRPRGFYRQISRLPRVMLVRPDILGLELIKRAALTAAITGTAAWESICLRKPTLLIGRPPFATLGEGFVHESNPARFPEAIAAALRAPPARDAVLANYVASVLSESFEMPSSVLWGDYDKHDAQVRNDMAKRVANGLLDRMSEAQLKIVPGLRAIGATHDA